MDGTSPGSAIKTDGEEKPSSFIRLVGAIIGFAVIMAFSMVYADKSSIMANWDKERCKLPIILTAFMYKPSDYIGSASDFSQDNFDFCIKAFANTALKIATEPALQATSGQIDAQGTISQLHNSIRLMIGNLQRDISKQVSIMYNRYKLGRGQAIRVFQHLKSAIGRLQGIMGGIVYIALSAFVSIMNTIELIVWIVIIIIIILTILFILLFFKLFPFTPLIIAVVVSLVAAGLGTMIGGAASVFCFAPDTKVIMKDGKTMPIKDLSIGNVLMDGGIVEGMFTFDASETPLYNYKGILVSGTHIIYCPKKKRYMEVVDHPDAVLTQTKVDRVYCPIVSSRHVPVQNAAGGLSLFCDWEEVSSPAATNLWMKKVSNSLGINPTKYADDAAGFNGNTVRVWNEEGQLVSIKEIQIGSYILDSQNKVKVLGIVRREGPAIPGISDGVWIANKGRGQWKQFFHPAAESSHQENMELYHLITDSGTFTIMYEGIAYVVRDATEVGIDQIRSLTPTVLSELNK